MEVPDDLLCLYTAEVEEQDGSYIIEVPAREMSNGQIQPDGTVRAALLKAESAKSEVRSEKQEQRDADATKPSVDQEQSRAGPEPPVKKGEERTVDIENLGDQGDGITWVERGFVVIVPDTEPNERVRIEITDVTETVAFGEVIERMDYYE